ncbi:MAG: 23S rRNA (guanosine(2251)-2'-O)-methyltransferase RlmB [Bacilli bacterium]|nr:23S rRNA (guanosine(2251)-2'-O)-methyltransferase RlmB [Bacilli bacterium]MDD4282436.1 23S rRNA (guanosine(2251)-2'-O)-methyltransferase RlmB [Bacilli bacterium]MDD4718907.1 23S rRNA (guanosine(2251)-2'-O)-methyltransferase RlmB [Bacilli bacterium]
MYVHGKNVAEELLKTNNKILKAFLYKNFSDKNIINDLQKQNIDIEWLEKFQLDKLVNQSHQGIILEVPDYKYANIEDFINNENALVVILDHLEDPHNLGAIIRTSEAAKVDGIIIPKDRSVSVNGTVMKVSAGALENVEVAQVTNLVRTMQDLKKNGFWIVGTGMDGTDFEEIDYKGKIAIVIGNEGKGLGRLVREECDFIASIPMFGKTNSLNASVAAGIIIYKAKTARR